MAHPIALITGASSGIGQALAFECASQGYDIILVARTEEKLNANAQAIQDKYGVNTHVFVKDLTEPGAAKAVYDFCTQKRLTVDLLINDAGFGLWGDFLDSNLEELKQIMLLAVNVLTELTYYFAQDMKVRRTGGIINLSSLVAFMPTWRFGVYAATKTYVLHFSYFLARELKPYGVKVMALCPGLTQTHFIERAHLGGAGGLWLMSLSKPEEVAQQAYRAFQKGKTCYVVGMRNKFLVALTAIFPRSFSTLVSGLFTRPK